MRARLVQNKAVRRVKLKAVLIQRQQASPATEAGLAAAPSVLARPGFDEQGADAAYTRLRNRAQALKMGPFDWEKCKGWRDGGRR